MAYDGTAKWADGNGFRRYGNDDPGEPLIEENRPDRILWFHLWDSCPLLPCNGPSVCWSCQHVQNAIGEISVRHQIGTKTRRGSSTQHRLPEVLWLWIVWHHSGSFHIQQNQNPKIETEQFVPGGLSTNLKQCILSGLVNGDVEIEDTQRSCRRTFTFYGSSFVCREEFLEKSRIFTICPCEGEYELI